ncbi:9853_t:CDS:2, partial [Diversispora eburnea]
MEQYRPFMSKIPWYHKYAEDYREFKEFLFLEHVLEFQFHLINKQSLNSLNSAELSLENKIFDREDLLFAIYFELYLSTQLLILYKSDPKELTDIDKWFTQRKICNKDQRKILSINNARVAFGASVIVGDDNFQNIISSRLIFVEKSMLVKEFIENSDFVSLILRPRRFGKSTNLSMLNYFFKISWSQEENNSCRQLFEKLKISDDSNSEIMQQHFAKYPVIHISLKDLTAGSWNEMIVRSRNNSENVAKAMLRIAELEFLSGLNNITIYPFHKEHQSCIYLDKFEFTSDEVELLLPLCEDLKINDVQKWCDDGILKTYWTNIRSTQTLEKCLWKVSSSFKESIEKLLKAEYVYHAFCLGIFANSRDRGFIVCSNREDSFGRYNVKIIPESGVDELAIIIEFKVVCDKKRIAFERKKACVLGHLLYRTDE